jgi:hypothetical protein
VKANTERFDQWIRGNFVVLNTELEEMYFATENPEEVEGIGDEIKEQLVEEGKAFIVDLLAEGNTDEGFDAQFDLLGNVGLYMAACRRHMITEPSRETKSPLEEASALSMQLGASLGVVPRFASAHLEMNNRAINGVYKTFTSLDDEELFLTYNTRAALAYIRASECLLRILPLGVSHPVTADLLRAATGALEEVIASNDELFEKLDTDRFFYCVRPYYKPHRVGLHEYRGANAGDFAGINVIDLLLGLCRADDAYYAQLLVDKFLFMTPEDQLILRDCMRRESLLDRFLEEGQQNTKVAKFIESPADAAALTDKAGMTASGPPLPVLLRALRKLADLRAASPRDDIPSRHADIQFLRKSLT